MGHGSSKQLFTQVLKNMLGARGIKVGTKQLEKFLLFIEEVCPWFPEEGTVNAETWGKVGKRIMDYYTAHGPEKVPIDAYNLWSLIKDCLDHQPEEKKLWDRVIQPSAPEAPPFVAAGAEWNNKDGKLSPEEQTELDEEAAAYPQDEWDLFIKNRVEMKEINKTTEPQVATKVQHVMALMNKDFKETLKPLSLDIGLSPLQKSMQEARKQGEMIGDFQGFFPVFENAQQQRYHEPIPFKQLKELKQACTQYGPTAPFTVAILEAICTGSNLPPHDWKALTRACLTGGDYLLWSSEYMEICQLKEQENRRQANPISYDMLTGTGAYRDIHQQLTLPVIVFMQIKECGLKAWQKLPNSSNKTEDLAKIRQGPDEPYQDFVARLMDAIGKVIGDEQAGLILGKQLAYDNANSACQAALRPWRKKGSISDYVRLCSDIGPSYVQGVALAAALQGKSLKEMLAQPSNRWRPVSGKNRVPGPPGSCYRCGQMGHLLAQCPQSKKPPGICPKCKKGKHWASKCQSRMNINGKSIPSNQGNWRRGQPQAPKQCYGAIQIPQDGQSGNCSEPPREAPAWTSAPPSTQY